MSARLQIILISIIAAMAALGFIATQLVLNKPVKTVVVHDASLATSSSTTESGSMEPKGLGAAMNLIPASAHAVAMTGYPLGGSRYWVSADQDESIPDRDRKTQSWVIDTSTGEATMIAEMNPVLYRPALQSLIISPDNGVNNALIVRRNAAWESPLMQDMQVISSSGTLKAWVEWGGDGWARVHKGSDVLAMTWHFPKPCTVKSGDNGVDVASDGLFVSLNAQQAVVVPFEDPYLVGCGFNDMGGEIQYAGFGEPQFGPEYPDKEYVTFQIDQEHMIKVDLNNFGTSGIEIEGG